ncbi:MAG: hypothetical protein IPM56_17395 [Ignavibacteriales bacterium]|nr:MAG: hypothetical protein IPM56_17395 [Ignavibacteriales bacterium]
MKPLLVLLTTLTLCGSVYSQARLQFFVKAGYNFFTMKDMKDLQNEFLNDMKLTGINGAVTESYPAQPGFQFGFLLPIKRDPEDDILLGAFMDFASTGGRVHYSDYSGEIKYDQIATSFSLGALLQINMTRSDPFIMDLCISPRVIFSTLNNEFLTRIGDTSQKETFRFTATSIAIEPGLTPAVKFGALYVGLPVTYLLSFRSFLLYEKYSEAYLVNKNNDRLTIDWSGFRAALMLKYSL